LAQWLSKQWDEHPHLVVLVCIIATILILREVYPPFEEKVLKRIMAGISVVIVAVVYFTAFALTAIGLKALGKRLLRDPRNGKKEPKTYWCEREKIKPDMDYLKRQF